MRNIKKNWFDPIFDESDKKDDDEEINFSPMFNDMEGDGEKISISDLRTNIIENKFS